MNLPNSTTVLIIGAGPVGLTLASKLVLRNIPFVLLERGKKVGSNILKWGHVSLFTGHGSNMDHDALQLLEEHGYSVLANESILKGREFVSRYLNPLSSLPAISSSLFLNSQAIDIKLQGTPFQHSFVVNIESISAVHEIEAQFVIDASGTWGNNNNLQSTHLGNKLMTHLSYNIPNRDCESSIDNYKNKSVLVIGSGHSAMNSLRTLAQHGSSEVHWAIRGKAPRFGISRVGGRSETLEKEIEELILSKVVYLHTDFLISALEEKENKLFLSTNSMKIVIDKVIANVGNFPDYSLIKNFDLLIDQKFQVAKALSTKIDPTKQSCGSINYSFEDTIVSPYHYYVVGMKSFGKASNFLLQSGYKILNPLVDIISKQMNI